MTLLIHTIQRLLVLAIGAFSIWLIVFVIFKFADHQAHWIVALGITYAIGAYLVLPYALRMGLKILQNQHVPSYTVTGDGLPGDPVNVVLFGDFQQLRAAFAVAGWLEADKLSIASSIRMSKAFIFKIPYPTAPFSTLYLFGRGQDIGFQKAIDNNPRKRHHIRFWALDIHRARMTLNTRSFWLNRDRPRIDEKVLWVGAGTRDTGLGFTRLTLKITHATDSDTNAERDFIMGELQATNLISGAREHKSSDRLEIDSVNHYITDGDIAVADLLSEAAK